MNRPLRQPEAPLDPDVLRLVEGIALTLAQEHHAAENAGKTLSPAEGLSSYQASKKAGGP